MIDCSKTKNYLAEKQRMTEQQKDGVCKLECVDCPLGIENNGMNIPCTYVEVLYPEKATAIIQKWSDEHPQRTYLSELLEHFPNAPLHATGIPKDICPFHLGLMSKDDCRNDRNRNCVNCWNQTIEDDEGGEEND